jgi:hypothetical protein
VSEKEELHPDNDEVFDTLVLYLTRGGVHGIAPVSQEPRTDLVNWKLYRVRWPDGRRTRHLIGRNIRTDEGRVCSSIKSVDLEALTFTSSSGRIYRVHGPNWHDVDASYVFGVWLDGIRGQAVEITDPFLRLLRMRAPKAFEGVSVGLTFL